MKLSRFRRLVFATGGLIAVWLAAAYLVLPRWWEARESDHPALEAAPTLTTAADGHAGDPLNLFIIAPREDLAAALSAAGWHPADPVSVRSSLRIAEDATLGHPYEDAPVSPLLLFGRPQDFAFEKPVGHSPRERHHVRFWEAPRPESSGRIAWWAAATYDRSVGLSHTTGEITHHISPDVDAERELVLRDLEKSGFVIRWRDDFQQSTGKNGGGDAWKSDGKLGIAERK